MHTDSKRTTTSSNCKSDSTRYLLNLETNLKMKAKIDYSDIKCNAFPSKDKFEFKSTFSQTLCSAEKNLLLFILLSLRFYVMKLKNDKIFY